MLLLISFQPIVQLRTQTSNTTKEQVIDLLEKIGRYHLITGGKTGFNTLYFLNKMDYKYASHFA